MLTLKELHSSDVQHLEPRFLYKDNRSSEKYTSRIIVLEEAPSFKLVHAPSDEDYTIPTPWHYYFFTENKYPLRKDADTLGFTKIRVSPTRLENRRGMTYRAPYFNIGSAGHPCFGKADFKNIKLKNQKLLFQILAWINLFWSGECNTDYNLNGSLAYSLLVDSGQMPKINDTYTYETTQWFYDKDWCGKAHAPNGKLGCCLSDARFNNYDGFFSFYDTRKTATSTRKTGEIDYDKVYEYWSTLSLEEICNPLRYNGSEQNWQFSINEVSEYSPSHKLSTIRTSKKSLNAKFTFN